MATAAAAGSSCRERTGLLLHYCVPWLEPSCAGGNEVARLGGFGRMLAQVFESVMYFLDRLLGPRTRADELYEVRLKLAAQAGPDVASHAEQQLALRLRQLRENLMDRFDSVQACAHCVRPRSASWPGGHCCSGHTRDLFTDDELAALKLAGTTAAQLIAPRTSHAGCVFRGPRGCSLQAAHRPSLCVRFTCRELQSELDRQGNGPVIAQLQEEIRVQFERFVERRNERQETIRFADLQASLCATKSISERRGPGGRTGTPAAECSRDR